jgi:hypothetical protein
MKIQRLFKGIIPSIAATITAFMPRLAYAGEDGNITSVIEDIVKSTQGVTGMMSAVAYISAVIMAVTAIIKLKEHVEDPRTSIKESLGRAIIAGALFALPYVGSVAMATIGPNSNGPSVASITAGNSGDGAGMISDLLGTDACDTNRAVNVINSGLSGYNSGGIFGAIGGAVGNYLSGGTIGQVVCYTASAFSGVTGIISWAVYISGIFLLIWGLYQLRDHIITPDKMPANQPVKKIILAGMFFAFPYVAKVVKATVSEGDGLAAVDPFVSATCGAGTTGGVINAIGSIMNLFSSGGASTGASASTTGGLDCMMVRLVSDLWSPVQMAVSIFCYLAGLILIALALRRMLDNMDKGVKSPVGMGTIGMILIGGALLSIDTILRAITVSIFPDAFSTFGFAKLNLYASLAYAPGIDGQGLKSVNTVITTVFAFLFLMGIISVVRGLFILKEVSNGGNASLMAGFTHIIGGGMAMNIGPLVMAVQNTLGLQGMGIVASATSFGI